MRSDPKEAMPVMRKRPKKLAMLRLSEVRSLSLLGRLLRSPNHLFSISTILPPSVVFRMALERSETRGEPLGKTCKTHTGHGSVKKLGSREDLELQE